MNAQQLQSVTVEAKVIRKDGTVEDLGTVAQWDRHPLRNLVNRVFGKGTIAQKEQ
jgi:hypothetical protein